MNEEYSLRDIIKDNLFQSKTNEESITLISDLKPTEEAQVEGKVVSKKLQKTKNDKTFLLFTIADKSQSIRAIDWYNAETNNNKIQIGDVIKVKGKIVYFENRLQINISNETNSVQKINIMNINPEKYLQFSNNDLSKLKAKLEHYIETVKDEGIKSLLKQIFLVNSKLTESFLFSPAAIEVHHAYPGGLLEHTVMVTELSLRLYDLYNEDSEICINKDIIIAGSLLHDIGKIEEYVITPSGIEKTEQGELIGHIHLGTKIVYEESKKITPKIKETDLNHLIHIILSHHGEIEYGSPVVPKTIESFIIGLSDNMDSKIAQVKDNIRNTLQINKNQSWSEYDKRLARKIKIEQY
ncbi:MULTISPECIES: 3'-5' exoribonuclease YhaM family protein [Petrotoga]|uniref:3'-5' exoribonuclease n=1 Tax=Petrotoga sibirica TaxID=156202 RepID=A0A4R8F4J3_9BACT|nr:MULTISPECIES: HD domain-containing protein [Petrotoga]TDX17091.1 3'-5' exoribonuclease [Petrotoga sibirica]